MKRNCNSTSSRFTLFEIAYYDIIVTVEKIIQDNNQISLIEPE